MFEQIALEHIPHYSFKGETQADFDAWKRETLPKVLATLGEFPDKVPLDPELNAEWEHDHSRAQN